MTNNNKTLNSPQLNQLISSLLKESSRLCGLLSNLEIDVSRHRAQYELVKRKVESVQDYMERREREDATLNQRMIYNTELIALIGEIANEFETLVTEIYKSAKQEADGRSAVIASFGSLTSAIAFICSMTGAAVTGNKTAVILAVSSGIYLVYFGCHLYHSKEPEIKKLLTDAERFRSEVQDIKMDLRLKSIDLKMEGAVPGQ